MKNKIIQTDHAPKAVGPYSQAVKTGNLLFVSGQIPFVPETMTLVSEDVKEQTAQCLKNLKGILEAEGLDFSHVVKVGVFIKNMDDFGAINEVYSEYFADNKPARACVEVARLPKDVQVEIEAIASYE